MVTDGIIVLETLNESELDMVFAMSRAGVECRRIVVGDKGRGTGKRAMNLLDHYCREMLGRTRIWLDVYDDNARGRHVYESCGYRRFKVSVQDGRRLLFYEKNPVDG